MNECNTIKFLPNHSDSKMTPQLIKKKYWEEKSRDARYENDDMRNVNDSIMFNRVPSAGIWVQDLNLSPRRRKILR